MTHCAHLSSLGFFFFFFFLELHILCGPIDPYVDFFLKLTEQTPQDIFLQRGCFWQHCGRFVLKKKLLRIML